MTFNCTCEIPEIRTFEKLCRRGFAVVEQSSLKAMENIDGGPGHLLLGLPSIAWQCLIETLLDIDCAGLAQLLRCSKLTRQLVLQHAPAITYCPRDGQNDDEVHQVATRRTDLALTLDFGALESRQRAEELLQRAALSKGPQGCSGWSAVTRLNILGFQVGHGCNRAWGQTSLSDEAACSCGIVPMFCGAS